MKESSSQLFHDRGPYHIETTPLICIANKWTAFYMIETFAIKQLHARARLRPSTVKASSVWIRWHAREQINDVMLKTLISYAKFLHRYFRMQHLTFLTSHFILFAHQKRAKSRLNYCRSHFQNMGPSFTIQEASLSVRTTS